jgi:heat shock protein HslJ
MKTALLRTFAGLTAACMLLGCSEGQGPQQQPLRQSGSELARMPGESASVVIQVPERNPWQVVRVAGATMPTGARAPTLVLDAEQSQASGFSGVNTYSGAYDLVGERLSFGALATTRMGGPPELMALEQTFLAALGGVDGWRMRDGALELLAGEDAVLRLAAAPETD